MRIRFVRKTARSKMYSSSSTAALTRDYKFEVITKSQTKISFEPFVVTFNVTERPRDELGRLSAYVTAAINAFLSPASLNENIETVMYSNKRVNILKCDLMLYIWNCCQSCDVAEN